ncbi:MAG TPA: hypothetical protein VH678_29470 [Xanthobacteraceae bacterium]|jgi:2-polyprenyl-6-methoxyphenol hydroxylase-like FAD-dependent oxidoreductase
MTEKSHGQRAIVISSSAVRLQVCSLESFLRRIGWQVDIYERSSIELISSSAVALASLLLIWNCSKLWTNAAQAPLTLVIIVHKRVAFDRRGDVIAEKPQLQTVTSWDRLRQALLKAIDRQRYHFGYVFERLEQDGSGVHVYFASGRSQRAALLLGCDGFRSSVRAYLAPEVQPIYSGYYIWRGAPNESDLSPHTRRTMFPYYSFFLGDQLQALGYPISGADDELRAGYRRYNWGWYRLETCSREQLAHRRRIAAEHQSGRSRHQLICEDPGGRLTVVAPFG